MKPVRKFAIPAALLVTTSACFRPAPPQTVSDFCLNDRTITVEVAPTAGADDPGNWYDSEETVGRVLEHNAVYRRLCPNR